jgi:hypothetical protein
VTRPPSVVEIVTRQEGKALAFKRDLSSIEILPW